MLPNPHNDPTRLGKGLVVSKIARNVARDLLLPPARIGLWDRPVIATSVPKASIHKDRHLLPTKNGISPAAQSIERCDVLAEAQASTVKCRPNGDLRRGVGLPLGDHRRSSRRRGRSWGGWEP
jgi:hypothetical protein